MAAILIAALAGLAPSSSRAQRREAAGPETCGQGAFLHSYADYPELNDLRGPVRRVEAVRKNAKFATPDHFVAEFGPGGRLASIAGVGGTGWVVRHDFRWLPGGLFLEEVVTDEQPPGKAKRGSRQSLVARRYAYHPGEAGPYRVTTAFDRPTYILRRAAGDDVEACLDGQDKAWLVYRDRGGTVSRLDSRLLYDAEKVYAKGEEAIYQYLRGVLASGLPPDGFTFTTAFTEAPAPDGGWTRTAAHGTWAVDVTTYAPDGLPVEFRQQEREQVSRTAYRYERDNRGNWLVRETLRWSHLGFDQDNRYDWVLEETETRRITYPD